MLAKFKCIGRIGFARLKYHNGRNRGETLHFSLATQIKIMGKYVTQWNNNFTISNEARKVSKLLKTGTLVYVEGNILSFHKDRKQINRFIVKHFRILRGVYHAEEEHENRYGDLPPEEYYDVFEESTDSIGDGENFYRSHTEYNPLSEDL